jgi:SAM-dependent methyltransferase
MIDEKAPPAYRRPRRSRVALADASLALRRQGIAIATLAPMTTLPRLLLLLAGCLALQAALARDVPFVPTPEAVVDKMLDVARVGPNDVVYDLGSGDGRIVIAAAKKGARAVGIDIDPQRIREARENARKAGVQKRVEFRQGDLFQADLSGATVVTLYLLSRVNQKLRPKLLSELKPGTRIVSHAFDMGDWKPESVEHVGSSTIYSWVVPAASAGAGRSSTPPRSSRP